MADITVYTTVFQREQLGPPFYFLMYDFSEAGQQRTRRTMEEEGFRVLQERHLSFSGENEGRIRKFTERMSGYVLEEANEDGNFDVEELERIINEFK